jgi:glutaredoxin
MVFVALLPLPPRVRFLAACAVAATWSTPMTTLAQPGHSAPAPEASRCFSIEVYVPEGAAGSPELERLLEAVRSRVGVALRVVDVGGSAANRERYEKICALHKVTPSPRPLIYGCGQAVEAPPGQAAFQAALDQLVTMTVFTRHGCPHCAAVKQYLPQLQSRYPALQIVYRDLASDRTAAADLERLTRRYQKRAVSVPVLHFCNTLHVGFDSAATTGRTIEQTLRLWTRPCPTAGQARLDGDEIASVRFVSFSGQEPSGKPLDATDTESAELTLPREDTGGDEALFPEGGELPLDLEVDNTDQEAIELPVLGRLDARSLGLPLFTLAVGLVDGFNPCAMWVLLFLLSILVNLRDRAKILAVAGTFVVISGLAYFAFMAAWLNVFRLIGLLRSAQITLGVVAVLIGAVHVKDFFAFKQGISLSIPESAKPGIYARVRKIVTAEHLFAAIAGAATLAVLVNVVELLCTAGLPAMYTQILTMRQLPAWQEYAYLGLYILAYMFDDSLMVGAVVLTLGKRKLQEREGRWLKLVSGLVILVLGVLMIFKPDWLV